MMLPRRATLLLFPFLASTLLMAADLSGTWDAAVESSAGSGNPTFVLKQDGEKISGDYTGALGAAKVSGTVKGEKVEFGFKVDAGGEAIDVVYSGTLAADGKKIAGTVTFGSLGEGTFTASRRP